MSAATSPSSGKRRRGRPLDEDVEDAAAGQPDRERVVVADAVALQHRRAGRDDLLGQLVDRALDAAAGDAADGLAAGPTSIDAPGWRGAERHVRDDGADADGLAGRATSRSSSSSTSRTRRPPPAAPRTRASECPATKSSTCGSAATIPPLHRLRSPALPRCGLTQTTRCASRRSRAHLLAEQRRRRRAPSRRSRPRRPRRGPRRAAPSGRGTPSAPRRAGCRRDQSGHGSPAAAQRRVGVAVRAAPRVTRVSRVPMREHLGAARAPRARRRGRSAAARRRRAPSSR